MLFSGYYIHVPWCRRRCPYCDFYLIVGKPDARFAKSILAEFKSRAPLNGQGAKTVYFGGGTPSLLNTDEIDEIIRYFFENKCLIENPEITLEANPEDLHLEQIKKLAQTKINRISLGVQSFDDKILKFLGRNHTSEQAYESIKNLLNNGFSNISVDLIIGVANEDMQSIMNALNRLEEMGVTHFSTYLLTIEKNTNFYKRISRGKLTAPDDDNQAMAYEKVQDAMRKLGYVQYEISSFAKEGYFSKHNQLYWAFESYLGLGPSAHSMERKDDGRIMRMQNEASLIKWMNAKPPAYPITYEEILPKDALMEALTFGLRNMQTGINPQKMSEIFNAPLAEKFFEILEKFIKNKWLARKGECYVITPQGALFADFIMREILCC